MHYSCCRLWVTFGTDHHVAKKLQYTRLSMRLRLGPCESAVCVRIESRFESAVSFYMFHDFYSTLTVCVLLVRINQSIKKLLDGLSIETTARSTEDSQLVNVQQVVRNRLPEQVCLEEATKCGQWFCWCHVYREVIPNLWAGDLTGKARLPTVDSLLIYGDLERDSLRDATTFCELGVACVDLQRWKDRRTRRS